MGIGGFFKSIFGESSSSYETGSRQSSSSSSGENNGRTVFDGKKSPRILGPLLNRGGEGDIHPLVENYDILVKIYHERIRRFHPAIEDKIEVMKDMELRNDALLAWPKTKVFGDRGEWIGFAMRRVDGYHLQTFCQRMLIAERIGNWIRVELVETAVNFVRLVRRLNQSGVIVGDINPRNFFFDPKSRAVYAIDCDSFQVRRRGGGVFTCDVAIADFQPPELHGASFRGIERSVQNENFAAAVMIFKMLMFGLHPYNHRGCGEPVGNMIAGKCPFSNENNLSFPCGKWDVYWSHLPYRIKSLFIAAFHEGNRNPGSRPSLSDWENALKTYRSELLRGWHETAMFPKAKKKRGKPYGENNIFPKSNRKSRSRAA